MDLLNGAPIVELSGDEFLPKEGITFAQQVNEYFISQGGKANSTFGEVLLNIKGIQNSKQHGMSRIANLKVNRLYVHEAFVIKTLFEDAASNLVHGSETTSPHPQGEVAKVLQNYVNANKNSKPS